MQISLNSQALPHALDRKNYDNVSFTPFRLLFMHSLSVQPLSMPSTTSITRHLFILRGRSIEFTD
jgi:hypothetical protein